MTRMQLEYAKRWLNLKVKAVRAIDKLMGNAIRPDILRQLREDIVESANEDFAQIHAHLCQEDVETEEVAEDAEETNPREDRGHSDPEAGARKRRDDNLRDAFGM